MADLIRVDPKTCTKCGLCAAVCPEEIITFQANDFPRSIEALEPICLTCGHCVAICPTGSLTHRDMPVEACPPVEKRLQVTAARLEHLFRSHRSIREFKEKPVPREVVTRLIEMARYAPTGHNNQRVRWLVIDNRDEMERIESIGADWVRQTVSNQPELASAMIMKRVLPRLERGKKEFLRDAPALVITHAHKDDITAGVDCVIALTYFDLAAQSLGLGCCWGGWIYIMSKTYPPLKEALSLPENHVAYGCMMLGYPKLRYYRLPLRKPPRITWR